MDDIDINSADNLLEELKNLNKSLKGELAKERDVDTPVISSQYTGSSAVYMPPLPETALDEDNLSAFILETSQRIIRNGLETIETLKDTVANTEDSRTMSGFAEIVTATNNVISTLNAINIEKKKATSARQLKELDIEARKQLKPSKTVNNTLNMIAPREAIIKMLEEIEEKRLESPVIDIEAVESPPLNDKSIIQ